jgi:COMPASS component SWD1
MNLSLHDPQFITADFPSTLTITLSYGHCTALQISPCGHYIASGLVDGTILIIDTWSNNVTCMMKRHSMPIIGLKWIYNENDEINPENVVVGLVSWSRDWKVCLHGLQNRKMVNVWEYVFTGGVWGVDIVNSGKLDKMGNWIDWELVVCRSGTNGICFVKYNESKSEDDDDDYDDNDNFLIEEFNKNKENDNDNDNDDEVEVEDFGNSLCCCTFYGGKYIISGTSKGWLRIIDKDNDVVVKNEKICNSNIKSVNFVEKSCFNQDSILKFGLNNVPISRLIVNSSDRILRQYDISNWYDEESEPNEWKFEMEQKYQDVVNRIQWNTVKFSPTGEYVCASTQGGSGAAHDVYIWETSMGSLVQILEGAHEELIDVDWGIRSTNGNVCCVSANGMDSGTIYIWGVRAAQKWSALAPDFEEIEQNIEYVEREDEFDLNGDGINDEFNNIIDNDKFDKFKVDVVTREEFDARGFKFIKGCIIDTEL